MAWRFPVLIFIAALCLPAAGASARAADPDPPPIGIGDLIEDITAPFKMRLSDAKAADELKALRERLEQKWLPPKEHCATRKKIASLETARGNYQQAIEDTEAYLGACNLNDAEKWESYKELGRLYLSLRRPDVDRATDFLRKAAAGGDNPDPDVYLYLGQVLALTERYDEAETQARQAMARAKEPREDDHRLLLFCQVRQEKFGEAVALLQRMATLFPLRNEYLGTLAFASQELGRERDAFLAHAFRYELDYLTTEDGLVGIANLYLLYGNPHRAARILEREMKGGRVPRTADRLLTLSNMWDTAREREKAQRALVAAAEEGKNGQLEFRAALNYFEDGNWDAAEKFLRRALREGGLMQPCTAHVLLGYARYYRGDKPGALRQFEGARDAGCAEEAASSLRSIAAEISGRPGGLPAARIARGAEEGQRALAASRQALKAAEEAWAARRPEIRRQWLANYERDRDAARRHLDHGALETAREDRATMALLIAGMPADKAAPETLARARRLHRLSRRRAAALEEAQSNLEQAAETAAQARRIRSASADP